MVAREKLAKGSYVCEYRMYRVYPVGSKEEGMLAEEYERNGEGSFVLQTAYAVPGVGRLCFDATRRYRDIGRLKNHSSVRPNLKPGRPLHVRGKWRVGLVAVKDVEDGEELTYDYCVRSQAWMSASCGAARAMSMEEWCG